MFKELDKFIDNVGDIIDEVISPRIMQGYIVHDMDVEVDDEIEEVDIEDIEKLYREGVITKEERDKLTKGR